MKIPSVAPVALVLMAAGCGGGANSTPVRDTEVRIETASGVSQARITNDRSITSFVVEAPLAAVWEGLQGVYQELEIPITRLEAAEGRIGNDGFKPRTLAGKRMSRWLDCGQGITGPHADRSDITMSLYTSVRPHENGAQLITDMDAFAKIRNSGSNVHCTSTSRLERLILERLQARLQARGGTG